MSLEAWMESRFIVKHETNRQEISDLCQIIQTDLKDAHIPALSPDRRLACCYQAILTAARAALRATGYRVSKGPNHHYYDIQSLQYTAKLDSITLRRIESMGKKRIVADYTRVGQVSESMVKETLVFAEDCCQRITDWIRTEYPYLFAE